MTTLYLTYCDCCERATYMLPGGKVPIGWVLLQFPDIGLRHLCSYRCVRDYAKRLHDDPPTAQTPFEPEDNPSIPMQAIWHYDPIPDALAEAHGIPADVQAALNAHIAELRHNVRRRQEGDPCR